MKRCLCLAFVTLAVWVLIVISCHAQTHVTVNLTDSLGTLATNRTIWLTPTSKTNVSGYSLIVSDRYTTNSGTTGIFTVSNINRGGYVLQVKAPPSDTFFRMLVTSTNLGTVRAELLTTADPLAVYPDAATAWSAGSSDLRYISAPTNSGTDGQLPQKTGSNTKWATIAGAGDVTQIGQNNFTGSNSLAGSTLFSGNIRLTGPTNAAGVFALGLDANNNVTTNVTVSGSGANVAAGTQILASTNGSVTTVSISGNVLTNTYPNIRSSSALYVDTAKMTDNGAGKLVAESGFSGNGSSLTALNGTQVTSGTIAAARGGAGTVNGIMKADGAGLVSAAVAGTDYVLPSASFQYGTLALTNWAQTITLSNGTDLSAVASNAAPYTIINLLPGTYNVTNAIRLKEGQSLIGQGRGNTFLKYWGYTVDSTVGAGDYWAAVLIGTNTTVSDMDIRCMLPSNHVFQACVGFPASAGAGASFGGTNFLVERVSMHGDTDNYYIDNGGYWSGTIIDCWFESKWDTFVQQGKEGSVVTLINPTMKLKGPSVCLGGNSTDRPMALRIVGSGTATNRTFNVIGGYIFSEAQICLNQAYPVAFYGTRFVSETNGFLFYAGDKLDFYGCQGVSYSRIASQSGGQNSSVINIFDPVPQSQSGEYALWGNPSAGNRYFATNINASRFFDGYQWNTFNNTAGTNALIVTGASSSPYNGIYTYKTNGVAGLAGTTLVYTNSGGKFLMFTTNTAADAPSAISDSQSMTSGLEVEINGNTFPGWGWDTTGLRVSLIYSNYFDGNGAGITNIPNAGLQNSAITINGTSVSLGGTRTLTLAGSDFANQGTATTLLHGNASGNPSFGQVALASDTSGQLPLANGGTGASLTDPNADRLMLWDDTDNAVSLITLGSGLTYTHSIHTLTATSSGVTDNASWHTNGDSVTLGSFIGTLNAMGFGIRVNNILVGYFDEFTGGNKTPNLKFGTLNLVVTNSSTYGNFLGNGGTVLGNYITNGVNNYIIGGDNNKVRSAANHSGILGGNGNNISGSGVQNAFIAGGTINTVSADNGVAIGGSGNTASGSGAWAVGANSTASHSGSFVWNDASGTTYSSSGANSFAVRGSGGMIFTAAQGLIGSSNSFQINSRDRTNAFEIQTNGTAIFASNVTARAFISTGSGVGTIALWDSDATQSGTITAPSDFTANRTFTLPDATGTFALTANNLSVFAATTSAQLAGVLSDETGSGLAVFATSPTLTTPTIGVATATSVNKVAITAPASSATLTIADGKTLTVSKTMTLTSAGDSGVLTFPNATATIPATSDNLSVFAATTSAQLAGVLSDETGSGLAVFATSPTLTTPTIGVASATSVNKWAFTAPTTAATLTAGGDSLTYTMPASSQTIVGRTSTDTLQNKTFDAADTGNVLKFKNYIYLTHPHLADGTGATIGTTATAIGYGHATFSNSADETANYVEYYLQVPEDIDTSVALRGRIKVLLGNTDTGTHRYVLSSVSVADSAVPTASTLANGINIDFAGDGSGANGDVETSAWTTLTSWAGALTAGQTWRIRFARDGNASQDASTVNSTELGLVVEYGVTQ